MKRLFFDMDNVLVDFASGLERLDEATKKKYEGHLDDVPGIFGLMDPMPGAIDAVHRLAKKYDVYILSTAPWKNPSAWSDKVAWVTKYFDDVFHKRLILSHHKDFIKGDYLIDDRPKHGAETFEGEWIQFGSERFPDWPAVVDYLDSM
jgi:5'(3')-deoxyribonucleotidase